MTDATNTKKFGVNVDVGFYVEVWAEDEDGAAEAARGIVAKALPCTYDGYLEAGFEDDVGITVGEARCDAGIGDVREVKNQ